ncbi:hypothetical protein BX600DRAFT_316162 [Xylariales sp. PMI_506]|nr:hypothetical protein BX600DRAFT_316162 [Xylariales sp. PMI_506]
MGGFSTWRTAVATVIWALAIVVNAQGYYYQDQSLSCSPSQDFQYLGCYSALGQPYPYSATTPTADLSRSWIQLDPGDNVNSTITPSTCTKFCREHNYKYTALWNGICTCGLVLPLLTQVTNILVPETSCQDPCPGDASQFCGSTNHARLWVDTSFTSEGALKLLNSLNLGYGKLGCFYKPNFDTNVVRTSQLGFGACFLYCAANRYPLVYMESVSNGFGSASSVNCYCGTDFGVGARAYNDSGDRQCQYDCSTAQSTGGCNGQGCCGAVGTNIAPVYVNVALLGCYLPIIPGYAPTAVAIPSVYTCFPTPASIAGRAQIVSAHTGSYSFGSGVIVATATPAPAINYINYGCYTGATAPLSGPVVAPLAANLVSVTSCTSYCLGQGKNWAALQTTSGGVSTCLCGTGAGTLGPISAMKNCNRICSGSTSETCGPTIGYVVYVNQADPAATLGAWYSSWSSTWSFTSTYSCIINIPVVGTMPYTEVI